MKPRIKLFMTYWDCGWKYELWRCEGDGWIGEGGSPKQAYEFWTKRFL